MELDALRGIAAVAVMLYHLTSYNPNAAIVPFHIDWGHYGVELFFVISGFVIFMTLTDGANLRTFAVSRFARLYPAYWCAIIVTVIIAWILEPSKLWVYRIFVDFSMMQHLFGAGDLDGSYWTLAVELQFYVAIGFLIQFGQIKRIIQISIIVLSVGHGINFLIYMDLISSPVILKLTIFEYGHFFILGICLYLLRSNRARLDIMVTIVLALMYSGWGGPHKSIDPDGVTYTGISIGITLVTWLASTGRLRPLRWHWLHWLGGISYPLYLLHQRIGIDIMDTLYDRGVPGLIALGIAIALISLMAWTVHVLIETPARGWIRSRLLPRPLAV